MRPSPQDAFGLPGGAARFTRDARRRITAVHFGESRVWDLVVPRVLGR